MTPLRISLNVNTISNAIIKTGVHEHERALRWAVNSIKTMTYGSYLQASVALTRADLAFGQRYDISLPTPLQN